MIHVGEKSVEISILKDGNHLKVPNITKQNVERTLHGLMVKMNAYDPEKVDDWMMYAFMIRTIDDSLRKQKKRKFDHSNG